MNSPEPYTPTPGGRYLMQPDGQRLRLDDAAGLASALPAVPALPASVAAPATPKTAIKE